jgi:hypothetical protein
MSPRRSFLYIRSTGSDPRVFESLLARYPDAQVDLPALIVPLDEDGPEEVLAECCAARVRVTASTVQPSAQSADVG